MSRRSLPLLLFGLVGLLVVSGAVSASSTPSVWGPKITVGGVAALHGYDTGVGSISCPTAGNCAAVGGYSEDAFPQTAHAFVVDETNGSWGTAIEIPGTANPKPFSVDEAYVRSVSCATPGNCAAGGTFLDNNGPGPGLVGVHPYVVDETNGTWGTAIVVTGVTGGYGNVFSVSCATAGNCAAGGGGFVVDEVNGSWGDAIKVPGIPDADESFVSSISCSTAGNCAAGGSYSKGGSKAHLFVVDETNGVWGNAIEIPGTVGDGSVTSVSCATPGNCAAGGYDHGAFVVGEANGVWGKAVHVPGVGKFSLSGVNDVSCGAAGDCTAGGYYEGSRPADYRAFVLSESHGSWGTPIELPGMSQVWSISCATAENCTAGGYYVDKSDAFKAVVDTERDGGWGSATVIPGTGAEAQAGPVSCATADSCVVGGGYRAGHPFDVHAFVAELTKPLPLSPGLTNCNGPYAGTGNRVIVPTGGRCTLVPGTHVTGDVTVATGGTLIAKGVGIGGALTIHGSATICQSKIRGDVSAVSPSGVLTLGEWSCARGNTFAHNVVVRNDRHDLRIQGNTVANLLIAHSGPVVVINNHATGSIRCTANNPQSGHGNTVLGAGTNTCPK